VLLDQLADLRLPCFRLGLRGLAAIQLAVSRRLRSPLCSSLLLRGGRCGLRALRRFARLAFGLLDLLLADEACLQQSVAK